MTATSSVLFFAFFGLALSDGFVGCEERRAGYESDEERERCASRHSGLEYIPDCLES